MNQCGQCPEQVEEQGACLCAVCSAALAAQLLAAAGETRKCSACGTGFPHTEARVIRQIKDRKAQLSQITPSLCWVCARLHLSALQTEAYLYL
jgi:hypothetical protein